MKKAEAFVFSRGNWIINKVREQKKQSEGALTIREGEVLFVREKPHLISFGKNVTTVEEAIWQILLAEAKAQLPQRVEMLAGEKGLKYSGVKIRRMKTRWGSCTAKNGINLNSWLMMLPEHLSDYVILHELAHTRYHNHGPRFWEYLDSLTGGRSRDLRKELRDQQIMSINTK